MKAKLNVHKDTFEKLRSRLHMVIPVKAGIQYGQGVHGFRVKPGMTAKGIFQRFHQM